MEQFLFWLIQMFSFYNKTANFWKENYIIKWQVVPVKKLEDKVNEQKPKDSERSGKKAYNIW